MYYSYIYDFLHLFLINLIFILYKLFNGYCPATSEAEFEPSPVPAGALHATADILYCAQAVFLEFCQALRAFFIEVLKSAQAVFTAPAADFKVVNLYADCKAVPLA